MVENINVISNLLVLWFGMYMNQEPMYMKDWLEMVAATDSLKKEYESLTQHNQ